MAVDAADAERRRDAAQGAALAVQQPARTRHAVGVPANDAGSKARSVSWRTAVVT